MFGAAEAATKLIARETIAENVLDTLREFCYTIEVSEIRERCETREKLNDVTIVIVAILLGNISHRFDNY